MRKVYTVRYTDVKAEDPTRAGLETYPYAQSDVPAETNVRDRGIRFLTGTES